MKITSCNVAFQAFQLLCEEAETNNLMDSEDCQFWVFERGYRAALQHITANIQNTQFSNEFVMLKTTDVDELLMH